MRHDVVTELVRRGARHEALGPRAAHDALERAQRHAHATDADRKAAVAKLGR